MLVVGCWLVKFDDSRYGYSGLGVSKTRMIGVHWASIEDLQMVTPARELSSIERGIRDYVVEQFKELGLS